jgi:hypothetical protein
MKKLIFILAFTMHLHLAAQEVSLFWAPTFQLSDNPYIRLNTFEPIGLGIIIGGERWAKFIAKAQYQTNGVDQSTLTNIRAQNIINQGVDIQDRGGRATTFSVGFLADLDETLFITFGPSYTSFGRFIKYNDKWYEYHESLSGSLKTFNYFVGIGIRHKRIRMLFLYEGTIQSITTGLAINL